MSKIEKAKKAIMDLLEALRVHVNMALCCEKPTVETDAMYQIVVDRANSWLSSIEPPPPVSVWEPHQQRVWIEKQELDERAWKLTEFVGGNPLFRKLTYEDQQLLYEQRRLMYQLSEVLDQRIKRFFPQEPEATKPNVESAGLVLPEFTPLIAELTSDNGLVRQSVEYPITPAIVIPEGEGLNLDKLVAAVEAAESSTRLETIKITAAQDGQASADKAKTLGEYWQESEAVTVSVTMAPGAEPLSAEKVKELDEYLQQHLKRRGSPKLFNVQDSDRPAFVIAHSFEEALSKWKVAVAEENATGSEYEEVPPAGIMHVCDGDELIIDRGFADKANS